MQIVGNAVVCLVGSKQNVKWIDQNKILTIRYLLLGDTNIPSARFFPIDCTTTVQVQ